tara:strand:- start:29514 stop:29684 length:171 start_codon:yes stop_codon:yes gene_type:complete
MSIVETIVEGKCRIRFTNTMDSYLLEHVFDSEEEAWEYIKNSDECFAYDSSCFEVE